MLKSLKTTKPRSLSLANFLQTAMLNVKTHRPPPSLTGVAALAAEMGGGVKTPP